jgi:hypothetical protein
MKATKKPVEIEFFTFKEIVEFGKQANPNSIYGDRAWNFEFKGHTITHENDECYIIPTLEGNHNFTPNDVLIVGVKGEIYPCKKDIFEMTYDVNVENSEKTLNNTTAFQAKQNVSDIEFWGNGDTFKLISKASSKKEGWMKSTKAMQAGHGCVVQVTTQQRNPDGSYSIAEALTFVPEVIIEEEVVDGKVISRKLIPSLQGLLNSMI